MDSEILKTKTLVVVMLMTMTMLTTTMAMMITVIMTVMMIIKLLSWCSGWTARTSYSGHYMRSAKLLHWNGRFKPWGRTSSFQDVWDRYFLPDLTKQFTPLRKGGQ